MRPIVKFGLTKSIISSTLHTAVRYGTQSLGGIGLFDPFTIQGAVQTAFLINHCCKLTPFSPIIHANLSTIQLEEGQGWRILENNYHETQQWLQTESCIRELWKLISSKHIHIYHLGTHLSTHRTHYALLVSHLALNVDLNTSELWAINCCRMSKGIFFIRNIFNHQGTHLQKSAVDTDTTFNFIHDLNCPRKNHTKYQHGGHGRNQL